MSPRSFNLSSGREMALGAGPPGHKATVSDGVRLARSWAASLGPYTLSQWHHI